jgi:AraC-like DNA-binding protein
MSVPLPTYTGSVNLIGRRFDRLKVLSYAGKQNRRPMWNCVCDCGTACVRNGENLQAFRSRGKVTQGVRSCGCWNTEFNRARLGTHLKRKTRAYVRWKSMHYRCDNPNNPAWRRYGGRGITVCSRWCGPEGFAHFFEDMGECPPGLSLERRENSKGYAPDNCYWATSTQQSRNRACITQVEWQGQTLTLPALAERFGLSRRLLYRRVVTNGWPLGLALKLPPHSRRRRHDDATGVTAGADCLASTADTSNT